MTITEVIKARLDFQTLLRKFLIQSGWEEDEYGLWYNVSKDGYNLTDEEALWREEWILED